jgi:hypothetical protein
MGILFAGVAGIIMMGLSLLLMKERGHARPLWGRMSGVLTVGERCGVRLGLPAGDIVIDTCAICGILVVTRST